MHSENTKPCSRTKIKTMTRAQITDFWIQRTLFYHASNRPSPHSTSVRTNVSTRTMLGWTFSYTSCIFVHPEFDSAPLFVGMQERYIFVSENFVVYQGNNPQTE